MGRMQRTTTRGLAVAGLGLLLWTGTATAQQAACDAIGTWAQEINLSDRWTPNNLGQARHSLPRHLFSPATEALFGKPALAWSQDEVKANAARIRECAAELPRDRGAARQRQALNRAGSAVSGLLADYLVNIGTAQGQIAGAVATLEALPPNVHTLRFNAALANLGVDRQSANQLNQTIATLPREQQAAARTLINALRDLPQQTIDGTVKTDAAKRAEALRPAARDALIAEINATQASIPGLGMLDRISTAVRNEPAGVFGQTDQEAIAKAITERRAGIGGAIANELVQEISTTPEAPEGFVALDRYTDERLLRLLPPAEAGKVREAAAARRKNVADAVLKSLQAELAALPDSDESLEVIDNQVLPGIQSWPVSASAEKPRFVEAAKTRREAILAAVTRAESGSVRGRVYEAPDGVAKLEFVDRRRVIFTQHGEAKAGTYEEERDGRILVTIPPAGTLVLTREGARLTGAGIPLRRARGG